MSQSLASRIFVGFSSVDTSIKQTQWTDLELIKRDLINHFYTRRGERVMRPSFGCIIWDLLFEPMTADNVSLIVEDATNIVQLDGRVAIQTINLVEYEHGIQLQINLIYEPLNIVDTFTLDFDRRTAESTLT
jgi:phage baseplate assembly protein W